MSSFFMRYKFKCFFSQALSHVTPLRDFFLRESNYSHVKRLPGDSSYLLVQRFGELMRKLWNPRNFKAHVSPHEMLQAVVLWSKKRFQFTEQGTFLNRFCFNIILIVLEKTLTKVRYIFRRSGGLFIMVLKRSSFGIKWHKET